MSVITAASLAITLVVGSAGIGQEEKPADHSKKSLAEWIGALKENDPNARLEARKALGPNGPYAKVAVPALIDAFKDPDVNQDAAKTLADYGPAVVPRLLLALKRPEARVRAGVAEALGYVRPRAAEAVPPLALALQDKYDRVREAAALALSNMRRKSKPALPALIMALKDKEERVREWAAEALEWIGPDAKDAVPTLIEALGNKKDPAGRRRSAAVLARIGPEAKEAVPALIEALPEHDLCYCAANALGEIGPAAKAAIPALIDVANDKSNQNREKAMEALGKIGPAAKDAVPLLIEALAKREKQWSFPCTVAEALGRIGPDAKAALPALTAIAQDLNEKEATREAAAKAVAKIDPGLAAKLDIETACLNVRLGKLPSIKLKPRTSLTDDEKKRIKALIRKLAEIDSPDFGMSSTLSGHAFAPLPDRTVAGVLVLTDHKIKPSDTLRNLVEQGPDALTFLLDALNDKTPTKLKVDRRFIMNAGFGQEVDGNPLNPLEKRSFSETEERDREEDQALLASYTLRVGEVCFVAIGQIVGRAYQAVRYQPTGGMVINSPVQSQQLCKRIRAIWSSKDSAKKLLDSLLLDYSTEGKFNGKSLDGWYEGSNLQVEAAMRLLYYFPKETAPLIAARLRSFDVHDAGDSDGWMKREVKNRVRTDEFIKAVSWCTEPDIQKALDDIAKRTDDKDIKEALKNRGKKEP